MLNDRRQKPRQVLARLILITFREWFVALAIFSRKTLSDQASRRAAGYTSSIQSDY